jgi:hypothetical protein
MMSAISTSFNADVVLCTGELRPLILDLLAALGASWRARLPTRLTMPGVGMLNRRWHWASRIQHASMAIEFGYCVFLRWSSRSCRGARKTMS